MITPLFMCFRCLEFQFDSVPIDRPAILKRLYHLFNVLIDRHVLTWQVCDITFMKYKWFYTLVKLYVVISKLFFQFFSSRFDTIISEIQNSSNAQSTYGGSDYPNAYRTAAGTSKASQQSTQLGAGSVCTEPIPVSKSMNNTRVAWQKVESIKYRRLILHVAMFKILSFINLGNLSILSRKK